MSKFVPQISVIIPVFRNSQTLVELYRRLCSALEPLTANFEILFVDDCCPEESWRIIESLGKQDPRVRAIVLANNIGQNKAVQLALQHCHGSQVVIIDADLQDPPEALPSLLAALQQGKAVVFAIRHGTFQDQHRMLTSRLFKRLIHWLTGVPLNAGTFMALNHDGIDSILAMKDTDPYIVGMAGLTGLPIGSVPIERSPRSVGQSAYSSAKRIRVALNGLVVILKIKTGWRWLEITRPKSVPLPRLTYIGSGFDTPK